MNSITLEFTYSCLLEYINKLSMLAGLQEYLSLHSTSDFRKINDFAECLVSSNSEVEKNINQPLYSIFNKLNGHDLSYTYPISCEEKNMIVPCNNKEQKDNGNLYKDLIKNLIEEVKSLKKSEDNISIILNIMEKYLSYIPYNSGDKENLDICAYDGIKIKAAIGACIVASLEQNEDKSLSNFLDKESFILYSAEFSGIQNFIYRVISKGALKSLRSRSFFLEMFMEHIIDEILEGCGVSRANLIYSGGGHCYILLPNTEKVISFLKEYEKYILDYLCRNFDISLKFCCAHVSCNANDLANSPSINKPYKEIFVNLRSTINNKKRSMYTSEQIRYLNKSSTINSSTECKVCGLEDVIENSLCSWCNFFNSLSSILMEEELYIAITDSNGINNTSTAFIEVPSLSGKRYMIFSNTKQDYLKSIRVYCKNKYDKSVKRCIQILVCDYSYSNMLEDLNKDTAGIDKIGIYRGDVDNLGLTFISGFNNESLARVSSFSRRISLFFKKHIKSILNGTESNYKTPFSNTAARSAKKVIVIYSGGDDVFVIGNWLDVVESSIEIRDCFSKYTSDTLTISGGLKLVHTKYPLVKSAEEVAELENIAKNNTGKDSLCLFTPSKENTFSWQDFKNKVIKEKYMIISDYFEKNTTDTGNSFLYNLLLLLQNAQDKINLARYAYILARNAPNKPDENYINFSENMIKWIQDVKDRMELITAIRVYIYINRKEN